MKLTELVQKITRDFLMIFASIIILITFLRQLYIPEMAFDLKSIYTIMAFAFISSLLSFILYAPHELSEKERRIRIAVHFISLEILLLTLASIFDIVTSGTESIILALQIAVIYLIVRLLSWKKDKKEAQQINEKLKALSNKL
ncbi:hypothetical protein A8F94_15245 [Bacillus sp. FJAT-27225]|uniref:DUF3021 family protein n=1 Tax=Bacillus sp. FJAT-27225 TaxID=1743144 RepID=UPI00080C28B5|nr:DUF3021 family protein [Bacillus sp. FJAT-27225]OCA84080.1 hypothetical protein A8F94_15245 [Bacillus sp. FJAT-27225]